MLLMSLEYQADVIEGLTSRKLTKKEVTTHSATRHTNMIISIVYLYGLVENPTGIVFHYLREHILATAHNLVGLILQNYAGSHFKSKNVKERFKLLTVR